VYLEEIEQFRQKGSPDEWYISKLIERSSVLFDSERAFEEIDKMVSTLLSEKEWDIFLIHCQYILSLARISGTTEKPTKFTQNLDKVRQKIEALNLVAHNEVRDLYAWYRI